MRPTALTDTASWLAIVVLCTFICSPFTGGEQTPGPASVGEGCDSNKTSSCVPGAVCSMKDLEWVCTCQPLIQMPLADMSACVRVERGRRKKRVTNIPCNSSLQCQKNVPLSSTCVAAGTGTTTNNVCLCDTSARVTANGFRCIRNPGLLAGSSSSCETDRDCPGPFQCVLVQSSSSKVCTLVPRVFPIQKEAHLRRKILPQTVSEAESVAKSSSRKQAESANAAFLLVRRKQVDEWIQKGRNRLFANLNRLMFVPEAKIQQERTPNEEDPIPVSDAYSHQKQPVSTLKAAKSIEKSRQLKAKQRAPAQKAAESVEESRQLLKAEQRAPAHKAAESVGEGRQLKAKHRPLTAAKADNSVSEDRVKRSWKQLRPSSGKKPGGQDAAWTVVVYLGVVLSLLLTLLLCGGGAKKDKKEKTRKDSKTKDDVKDPKSKPEQSDKKEEKPAEPNAQKDKAQKISDANEEKHDDAEHEGASPPGSPPALDEDQEIEFDGNSSPDSENAEADD